MPASRRSFVFSFALLAALSADVGRAADKAPVQIAAPAAASSAATSDADEPAVDPLVESFLTASISYLNQAYLSVGILGDTLSTELYEDEQIGELLSAHYAMAEKVEKQLTALAKTSTFDADDKAVVEQLVKIAGLIKTQTKTLEDVWSGDEAQVAVWEKLREETSAALEVFEPEEQTAEAPAEAEKR